MLNVLVSIKQIREQKWLVKLQIKYRNIRGTRQNIINQKFFSVILFGFSD